MTDATVKSAIQIPSEPTAPGPTPPVYRRCFLGQVQSRERRRLDLPRGRVGSQAISLGLEKVEYEPEQFPGLVYRIDEPKVVVLLFGSGKLVCTGARKPSDVEQAVEKITQELKAAGLLR